MAIGTDANATCAFWLVYNVSGLSTEERLLLLLLVDACVVGLGIIDVDQYAGYMGVADGGIVNETLKLLARRDIVSVSDIHGRNVAVALGVAEADEIVAARNGLGCDFPFIVTTQKHGSAGA